MKKPGPRAFLVLALIFVSISVISQIMRAIIPNLSVLWWIVFGVASLCAAGVAWWEKQSTATSKKEHEEELRKLREELEHDATRAATAMRVALEDSLDPLINSLGRVASSSSLDEKKEQAGQVMLQGLHAIVNMLGDSDTRVRANFFSVAKPTPRHEQLRLVHQQSLGRAGKPRDAFNAGEPDGEAIFEMLIRDETRFCADILEEEVEGMNSARRRDYRTFISCPARVQQYVQGMVTVDAPAPEDLSELDIPFVRAVSTIIASAYSMAEQADERTAHGASTARSSD